MSSRASIFNASRKAAEFLLDGNARERIKDGYTRIDPLQIADQRGLTVLLQKLETLLGAYLENPEPGILINNDRPAGLIHMTEAHELGHYAMGHGTTMDHTMDYGDSIDPKEQEADAFAYALLAPRWLLVHTLGSRGLRIDTLRDPKSIYQLSLRMGLSYSAMLSTLVKGRFINYVDAQHLRVKTEPQRSKVAGLLNDQRLERTQDLWILGPADRDCVLEPRVDDLFVLDVPNNLASGYLWTIDEARSEGFVLLPEQAPTAKQSFSQAAESTGDRAQYVLERANDEIGNRSAEFLFSEIQPWLGRSNSEPQFQIRAEFEVTSAGLSEGSKRRRLEMLLHAD